LYDYLEAVKGLSPLCSICFDLDRERQARLDVGLGEYLSGHDLYPDARPCLQALKGAGYFVGVAGNQTARAGRFLRELNLPCDVLATSDEWGETKPDLAFFEKMIAVSGHDCDEIAYVGDRLDNDIAPAAEAGLFTVWLRRGPWGFILQPGDLLISGRLRNDAPSLTVNSLGEFVAELTGDHAEHSAVG